MAMSNSLLLSPGAAKLQAKHPRNFHIPSSTRPSSRGGQWQISTTTLNVVSMAKGSDNNTTSSSGTGLETAAIAGGLVSNPVIGWSLYTLKTTGCGLPPGPGGSIGALEGVSYLVVVGIISWSLYTKAKTGSGLPSGPYGLLGAIEGLSYLSLLAILVVFGLQVLERGYIPGPVPGDQCFG